MQDDESALVVLASSVNGREMTGGDSSSRFIFWSMFTKLNAGVSKLLMTLMPLAMLLSWLLLLRMMSSRSARSSILASRELSDEALECGDPIWKGGCLLGHL